MKPANATIQDDIPPVHVLEAAQNQERKETEDLLAGFDRPGRSPKAVPKSKERDFVDYYARKKPGGVESGQLRAAAASPSSAAVAAKPPRQADVSTVIVPRKREGMPLWLGWAAVTLGMLLVGWLVAYLATTDARSGGAGEASATSAASAATTITSGTAPVQANGRANADTNIPPPAPIDAMPTTATAVTVVEAMPSAPAAVPAASGGRKREGRAAASAGASAATAASPTNAARPTNGTDETKPPPRDDFIRDL